MSYFLWDKNMKRKARLDQLCVGESARVEELLCEGSIRRRFLDIGLIPGTKVQCVGTSPLGDPSAYLIRGALIAIRRRDARGVALDNSECSGPRFLRGGLCKKDKCRKR